MVQTFRAGLELADAAEAQGTVDHEERDMIASVFALGDTVAREVMVPRTAMVWVPADMLADEAERAAACAAATGPWLQIVAGCATLVRPVMLFFLPLALLWMLRRRRPALAVTFLVAILAVVLPWTARNYRVYDRFVLVASEGGVTFWTGTHPLSRGDGDLAANPELKRAELAFRQSHPGLTAEQLEPLYYRDAFRHIAANPNFSKTADTRNPASAVTAMIPLSTARGKRRRRRNFRRRPIIRLRCCSSPAVIDGKASSGGAGRG